MTIKEFETLFPTDDACKAYLQSRRWPIGVACPRCINETVYPVTNKPFHWQCTKCAAAGGYRFSVLVGTIFENTNVGLRDWFRVIHMMLTSKKGVAALQVQRVIGFGSYRTAHYLCMRVRAGLVDPAFRQLMGILEVDETFIGGKSKNKHVGERLGRRGTDGKLIIIGAVERKGTIEGFWFLMKRGIMGTYHKVSAKYLLLYVAAFESRYNNRNNRDIFGAARAA